MNNNVKEIEVIVIDDEDDVRNSLIQTFALEGIKSTGYADPLKAISVCAPKWPGIVICDLRMPKIDGLEVLERILEIDDNIPVILFSAHADISIALKAVRQGAYDFLEKTEDPQTQVDTVIRAIAKRSLVLENIQLREYVGNSTDIESRLIGHSRAITKVRSEVLNLAQVDVDVIINGETGTGKEVVAKCIHDFSSRKASPFVAINCGAMSENLIESELFGHEAGAFTGALKKRIGKLEYANGGTIFLDEVESMPHYVQIRLLRVLQERYIERVGANNSIEIDVRVIAASKLDLQDHVANGEFRQDLYYRLNVANINLPSVNHRKEDIGLLFSHFASLAATKHQKKRLTIPPSLVKKLEKRDWIGNVREISNEAEKWVLGLTSNDANSKKNSSYHSQTLDNRLEDYEKMIIEEELSSHDQCISDTAKDLGIPRKKLYLRMKKYGIGKYGQN